VSKLKDWLESYLKDIFSDFEKVDSFPEHELDQPTNIRKKSWQVLLNLQNRER